ncbi:hypothetical protein GWG54_16135 [Natronococcus sp. JC468]|uniref:hypothetical protein n=1 Tax=Natronococcus sp. JC468 TaxID=1961921 RepID=UPI00143C83CA|nr:hypothetical protein [Natronococcus sp. JC468]NKE37318.1 hypothetical protein [Natronococcus sp. JC468]
MSTLGASLASPVAAQTGADNTTVPTPSDSIGNESGNNSSNAGNASNESSGGIGNWVSNATPSIGNPVPSPWEAIKGIVTSGFEDAKGGLESLISELNMFLLGLPAPGEPDDPGSWFSPDNEIWSSILGVYAMMSGLAVVLLVIATQFALGMSDMKRQRQMYRKIAKAFALGPLFGIPLLALGLHGGNAVTMALTPSGDELLTDIGEISNLGLGIVFGGILLYFKTGAVFLGLVIIVVIYFTILLIVAAWPALWAMTVSPFPTLQSWGEAGLITFGKLILLRATQGFVLRVTFALPWGSLGEATLVIGLIGTLAGVGIAFLALPYYVLRKVTIASAVSLGMSGVSTQATSKARSGASRLRSRLQESRTTDTPSPSKSRGNVKQRAYSGSSKESASSSSRSVGSFGGGSSSSNSSSRSSSTLSLMQSKHNADRASKTRADD